MDTVPDNTFLECCGSTSFAAQMAASLPFSSLDHALKTSRSIWWNQVNVPGWLEAFAAHPKIGDVKSLEKKFSQNKEWAAGEQSTALNTATTNDLQELADWNQKYEAKFGFIFLICASGKTCVEIVTALKARFSNRPVDEIQVAAAEQQKITEIRLSKLQAWSSSLPHDKVAHLQKMQVQAPVKRPQSGGNTLSPPITTHVLDVSLGRPGVGIGVTLEFCETSNPVADPNRDGAWSVIGSSVTNSDGRSGALMSHSNLLKAGTYRLTFKTGDYLVRTQGSDKEGAFGFYPLVHVVFQVKPSQVSEHFHVPLLISPYSYTTYRGS